MDRETHFQSVQPALGGTAGLWVPEKSFSQVPDERVTRHCLSLQQVSGMCDGSAKPQLRGLDLKLPAAIC